MPSTTMMFLSLRNNISTLLIALVLFGCMGKNPPSDVILKEEASFLKELGNHIDLDDSSQVFLFVNARHCDPCISELRKWDRYLQTHNDVNIHLFIVDRLSNNIAEFERSLLLDNLNVYVDKDLAFAPFFEYMPSKILYANHKIVKQDIINDQFPISAFLSAK